MIKLNSNKGITLIVLVITIIVILIITGISITLSIDSIDQTVESQDLSEMLIVQHAIKEKYEESEEKKDLTILVGKKYGYDNYEYEIKKDVALSDLEESDDQLYIAIEEDVERNIIESILYKIDSNNNKIKLEKYQNAIDFNKDSSVEIEEVSEESHKLLNENWNKFYKIKNKEKIKINCFTMLGITGNSTNSTFIVNYKTGYVEKVVSSASSLKGYNQDTSGNTTSHEVSITN